MVVKLGDSKKHPLVRLIVDAPRTSDIIFENSSRILGLVGTNRGERASALGRDVAFRKLSCLA